MAFHRCNIYSYSVLTNETFRRLKVLMEKDLHQLEMTDSVGTKSCIIF